MARMNDFSPFMNLYSSSPIDNFEWGHDIESSHWLSLSSALHIPTLQTIQCIKYSTVAQFNNLKYIIYWPQKVSHRAVTELNALVTVASLFNLGPVTFSCVDNSCYLISVRAVSNYWNFLWVCKKAPVIKASYIGLLCGYSKINSSAPGSDGSYDS